jgi:hypothetical protein
VTPVSRLLPRDAPFIPLSRPYPSRYGVPVISAADPAIFRLTYFTHCLACTYCHDQCCEDGVDVDLRTAKRIERDAARIEAFTGIPRTRWFQRRAEWDEQLPGGGSRRTRIRNGACVFLNRKGRGCLLHSYALARGLDYHDYKSIVDCLFPITFADGTLVPADEIADDWLVCRGTGPSLFRGVKGELEYYFGAALVAELAEWEGRVT